MAALIMQLVFAVTTKRFFWSKGMLSQNLSKSGIKNASHFIATDSQFGS
jgi:hypothetical protein